MKLYPLSFIQLHNMIHMQGVNLGDKIDASKRPAKLYLDLENQMVWISFKGKMSGIPTPSVMSFDMIESPAHLVDIAPPPKKQLEESMVASPKRGRPPKVQEETVNEPVGMPPSDPSDVEAAAAHRARVRAASMNSNKTQPLVAQNDFLIQEARNQAMGLKHPTTSKAQVQNAQQVGASTVQGKPKAISHTQMKAQVKAEEKTNL